MAGAPDCELLPLKPALVNNNNHSTNNTNNNHADLLLKAHTDNPSSASLFDHHLLSKRSTASKRLQTQFKNEEFSLAGLGGLTSGPAPSRRREAREAMQNLRKRVPPRDLPRAPPPEGEEQAEEPPAAPAAAAAADAVMANKNANRPNLLQRILSHRPMSIVVEPNEVQTAWQDSDFITECLCWHNVYRQRHGAPTLSMSPELCEYAQTWANHLAHTNKFYYRNDRDIGQNLFQRPVSGNQGDVTGQEVSSYWYAAVRQYDYFKEPDVLHANVNSGHFTQVVWASTRSFGVGKARSRAGKVIVVAHYSPPGNLSGAFEMNVLPPIPEPGMPGYDPDNTQNMNIQNMQMLHLSPRHTPSTSGSSH